MKTVFRPRYPSQELRKKVQLRKFVSQVTAAAPTVTLVVSRLQTAKFKHILAR